MKLSFIDQVAFYLMKQYKLFLQQTVFIFLLLFVGIIQAQNFPSKPLKVIVTYPAGGSSDLITRVVG